MGLYEEEGKGKDGKDEMAHVLYAAPAEEGEGEEGEKRDGVRKLRDICGACSAESK